MTFVGPSVASVVLGRAANVLGILGCIKILVCNRIEKRFQANRKGNRRPSKYPRQRLWIVRFSVLRMASRRWINDSPRLHELQWLGRVCHVLHRLNCGPDALRVMCDISTCCWHTSRLLWYPESNSHDRSKGCQMRHLRPTLLAVIASRHMQ